ncbi:NAD(P)-dependent oxidoreductase [Steroidobacter cummioxidans]|uniref:NAD(P)-dependent oxidoreductase n=1 Tax=Steroidobacter cummioxidans TaxID=1803913 RepID=UPI000E312568|nr:NAD(P)-dependent oxidoreductase [Steroidobacter cummioxidans]
MNEDVSPRSRIGFLGLGLMGQPMAANLSLSGTPLMVWNRTSGKTERIVEAGATVAIDIDAIFDACETLVMMLATPAAIDEVLGRGGPQFKQRLQGRLIINTGTASPEYSSALAADIRAVGGRYVEAPVSGSRKPAEERQLVAMVAGDPADVAVARRLLGPICRETFDCGPVPGGLRMKLAVNLFMIVMVTGLVETFHFAERANIDANALRDVLAVTPMANPVSQVKAAKLAAQDWAPQAALADVLKNVDLILDETGAASAATPLIETCRRLYGQAVALDRGTFDMVAVQAAYTHLTGTRP